jgi:hypothetical protein
MIKQYILVLFLTYLEYFFFFYLLEYSNRITWESIKFWLKYPPFICFFFLIVDSWIIATMIYITFFYPYLLMAYCIKNVNKNVFKNNKIIINNGSLIKNDLPHINKTK